MEIRKASVRDCPDIARIHQECLSQGFLGTLGERFLTILYETLVRWDGGVLFVAQEGAQIIGFVSGVADRKDFLRHFLKRNIVRIPLVLLPALFRINVAKKIKEVVIQLRKGPDKVKMKAELISIAVLDLYRGTGASQVLFERLVEEFQKKGISSFHIIVGDKLDRAKRFYQKMGCRAVSKCEVHQGEKSLIYFFAEATA